MIAQQALVTRRIALSFGLMGRRPCLSRPIDNGRVLIRLLPPSAVIRSRFRPSMNSRFSSETGGLAIVAIRRLT
jgi:hypothetical protein